MTPHPYGEDSTYTLPPGLSGRAGVWNRGAIQWTAAWQNGVQACRRFMLDRVACSVFCVMVVAGMWLGHRMNWQELRFGSLCHGCQWKVKRAFDFTVSLVSLILLAPLFLVLALVIKMDSEGPVFFRQVRVGVNRRHGARRRLVHAPSINHRRRDRRRGDIGGRLFSVIKFRTMVNDAERKCGPVWATHNDPRITTVGRFLRRTRLDELPQLINILRGEMSLVGPRPERPYFVEQLKTSVDQYTRRLDVPPGITGLAQVENGYDASVEDVHNKVAYDLRYIDSWSLKNDIQIMAKTAMVMVTGRGAN